MKPRSEREKLVGRANSLLEDIEQTMARMPGSPSLVEYKCPGWLFAVMAR
jgi:hypothetical protein